MDRAVEVGRCLAMLAAGTGMTDYDLIRLGPRQRFYPQDAADAHDVARAFLERELPSPGPEPVVVVTHMAPSARSIHPWYHDSALNPAYASNLDGLVEASGAALWLHGHTHTSFDYRIGKTRVVCNPRGYANLGDGRPENSAFDPNLLIEV